MLGSGQDIGTTKYISDEGEGMAGTNRGRRPLNITQLSSLFALIVNTSKDLTIQRLHIYVYVSEQYTAQETYWLA